jgi:flagellar protein FliO/FliZ
MEYVGLLLVFAIILLLAFYTTKLVGKKFTGGTKNKNMRIVETLPLGLDRCLYLILVGKKHFLFFSGKKGIELVSEIEMEEQPDGSVQEESTSTNIFDFRKIFETYSGLSPKAPQNSGPVLNDENAESKSASILGNIKRLQKINKNKD